jgi:TonB family protein
MTRLTTRHILISPSEAEGLLLQKTAPVYPPAAKAAHVSGTVVMHAVISKTGIVEDIHVVGGPQLLQQAAMDAVKNWIYRPYMQNGKAENVITTVNLVFALEERPAAPPAAAPDEAQASTPAAAVRRGANELSAWELARNDGRPEAYWQFYLSYPHSGHIKTVTGTLRGRYWFKLSMPFGDDGKHRDGVIVTAEGENLSRNLTLDEAEKLDVIGYSAATADANPDSQGRTFNHIYFEATDGGVLAGNQIITPKDNGNSTLILSADGTQLLSWDLGNAKSAEHPSTEPTMKQNEDGSYPCAQACP